MVKELQDVVRKSLGSEYGLSFYEGDSVEVEFWSPAGEDMPVSISGDTLEKLVENAKQAFEGFDAEDHASQIYHAKHYGSEEDQRFYRGAPGSLDDLLKDARSIKASLEDVYKRLNKAFRKLEKQKGK